MPKDPSIHLLMDPAAVKANQAGRITDAQRAQHKPLSRWETIVIGLVVGLFVVAFLLSIPLSLGMLPTPYLTAGEVALALLGPAMLLPVASGLAVAFLFVLAYDRRLTRELVDGPVAQAEGQVVFRGGMYQAQIDGGHPLGTITGSKAVHLPPGKYRFSYLPLNKCILSAERLNPDEPGGPLAGVQQALAQANSFTWEDVPMNRQGLLSDRQRVLSDRQRAWVYGSKQTHEQDIRDGRVAMIEGVVECLGVSERGSDWCVYEIVEAGGTRVRVGVSDEAAGALIPEIRYRVYYLPHTRQLTSIEPLS